VKRALSVGAAFLSMLLGCGAPRAVALKGKAADAVRLGIRSGRESFSSDRFDRVLKRFSREGGTRFDYRGLAADRTDLDAYLEEVAKADLTRLSRDELLAMLVNAYNAFTLRSVLETMTPDRPLGAGSILDIPHVFDRAVHRVGGFTLSLDNIEHNLIRPLFRDPRTHFVVNCASRSCSPLPEEAIRGKDLDSQLERAAHRVLSAPAYARVEGGILRLTKILDWYGTDFTTPGFHGAEKTIPAYVRKYAAPEVVRFLDGAGGEIVVDFLDYDWSLNLASPTDPPNPPR
jgi:uncharacterized protein DUF547